MIEPEEHPFVIWRGATFRKIILFFDEQDNPKDFTGYTGVMNIRPKVGDPTILLSLTSGDGITFGGVDGTIELFIDSTVTDALPWKGAYYDFKFTAPSTDTDTILYGKISVHG